MILPIKVANKLMFLIGSLVFMCCLVAIATNEPRVAPDQALITLAIFGPFLPPLFLFAVVLTKKTLPKSFFMGKPSTSEYAISFLWMAIGWETTLAAVWLFTYFLFP